MKLKVCGITAVSQLQALSEMDVDFAGLIFVKSSPRYGYDKLAEQKKEVKNTPITKVGVFVNEKMEIVKRFIDDFGLGLIQLHGDEDPDYVAELNRDIAVVKAFRIFGNENILDIIEPFDNTCSFFLFDTASADGKHGGTGRVFNWEMLSHDITKPFFLSGGIAPSHAEAIKEFSHPSLFAIDINSKFETEPGVKDLEKVLSFKTKLDQKRQTL